MVHYRDFRLNKVNYEIEADPPHVKITYQNKDSPLVLKTPVVTFPFGIDTAYDKHIGKMRFENYKTDSDVNDFMNVMISLEKQMQKYLEDTIDEAAELISEFKFSDKYDPTINIKLPTVRDKIVTRVVSKSNSMLSYLDIEKGSKVTCMLLLDSIWKVNNKFYYKWKALEIKILD